MKKILYNKLFLNNKLTIELTYAMIEMNEKDKIAENPII